MKIKKIRKLESAILRQKKCRPRKSEMPKGTKPDSMLDYEPILMTRWVSFGFTEIQSVFTEGRNERAEM
jgi:hypothetical protein